MTEKIESFLKENNIKINIMFMPLSFSRNHSEKNKTINWLIRLESKNGAMVFDYTQGIALLPNYNRIQKQQHSVKYAELISEALEIGSIRTVREDGTLAITSKPLIRPENIDILSSLSLDSCILDMSFKEWSSEYGYDRNSIKDHELYQECLTQSEEFVKVIGSRNKVEELKNIIEEIEYPENKMKI